MSLAEPVRHRHPHADELVAWREVGRAHLWSGEPHRALEALAPLHRVRPCDREVQHLMLEALFALGRSEGDYPWTLEPVVVRLDAAALDRLHRALLGNRGPVTLLDLLLVASEQGYVAFSAGELLAALDADRRFTVRPNGPRPEAAVVGCTGGADLGHRCRPGRPPAPA